MSNLERISKFRRVIKKDGKYQAEVTTLKSTFDPILREWSPRPEETVTYEEMNERDGVKELSINLIEVRQALDPNTLKTLTGAFLRKATVTVSPEYETLFLTQANNRILLNVFGSGLVRELTMVELFGKRLSGLNVTISEGERISNEKAKKMFENKEVFPYPIELIGEGANQDVRVRIG